MPANQPAPIKIRVAVVVLQQPPPNNTQPERILLVRQNNRPFWVLPGGTLELGETLEACAIRELEEEVNLKISIDRLLYVSEWIEPATEAQNKPQKPASKHTIDTFFLAPPLSATQAQACRMTPDENLNEIGWFTRAEAQQLCIQPERIAQKLWTDWSNNFSPATTTAEGYIRGI